MRNADAAVLSKRISNQSTTDYISLSLSLCVSIHCPSCIDTVFSLSTQLTQVKSPLSPCFVFTN